MDLREKTQNNYRHPWELGRANNLLNIVQKYLPNKNNVKVADICAWGYVL